MNPLLAEPDVYDVRSIVRVRASEYINSLHVSTPLGIWVVALLTLLYKTNPFVGPILRKCGMH